MGELASVIHQIRTRLHLTTRQLGERLGVRHTAISRWERNEMQPGFLALRELLKVAEGTERNPLLDRLARLLERSGLAEEAALIQFRKAGMLLELPSAGWRLVWKEPLDALESAPPQLAGFAELSTDIVRRGKEVDPSLVMILALWLAHDTTDDAIRGYFADAAKFLEVSLATWKAKQKEADAGSGKSEP